jgi:hypothetical protein
MAIGSDGSRAMAIVVQAKRPKEFPLIPSEA